MATTTCTHQEEIQLVDHGIQDGTCKICHQIRRYNTMNELEKPKIIKLGRINGAIVLPGTKELLELSAQESAELYESTLQPIEGSTSPKGTDHPHAESRATITKPTKAKRQNIRERAKKCKGCQFYQIHDEMSWCTSQRCRSRYPSELRPPFRPPAPKLPSATKVTKVTKALKTENTDGLPSFPAWTPEKWGSEMSVQWLRTYEALVKLQLIKELVVNQISPSAVKEDQKRMSRKRSWLSRLFRRR